MISDLFRTRKKSGEWEDTSLEQKELFEQHNRTLIPIGWLHPNLVPITQQFMF